MVLLCCPRFTVRSKPLETTITSKNYNGGSEVGLLWFARLGANTNGTMAQKE